MAQKGGIRSRGFQLRGLKLLQKFDGIVVRQLPRGFIQMLKEPTGIRLPTPPQVICQLGQTLDPSGQRKINGSCTHRSVFPDFVSNREG